MTAITKVPDGNTYITGSHTAREVRRRRHPSSRLASPALAAGLRQISLLPRQERPSGTWAAACVAEGLALKDEACRGRCALAT